ncbi:GAP1-N1 domain-containing protein, partial [Gluconobacter thailandicus]|uniref:GAP1-N1 domain-containing protein n=1 Tax=Gluconobacter thailandicus TaxID=257438 RepID=UPI00054FB4DE
MVTTESFRVDQIVHGYARGHKELARSLDLDDHSRATMVVMSDLLIDRVLQEDVSYLACYPLPSAARHVLARTWSAGPDYRPGSVWTHSLLLDYATLAQIHDL